MWQRIKGWYQGETRLDDPFNDPNSPIFFVPAPRQEYHWSARIARTLIHFYLRNWQWFWVTGIAAATLYYTVLPTPK
ncbi:hypothetical protein [Ralstonia sp.]|uniref:hypothetical protein n=1 Tax=Ralstonia sp. TaxID=54061 RepID=UPI0031D767A7